MGSQKLQVRYIGGTLSILGYEARDQMILVFQGKKATARIEAEMGKAAPSMRIQCVIPE